LLVLGTQHIFDRNLPFQSYFNKNYSSITNKTLKEIVRACRHMAKTKTGALIVISARSELLTYIQTGDFFDAEVKHRLLETLFFKNSPMHDGAVIIVGDKIKAARCILPVDDNLHLSARLGLRHRAAVSMAMETDTVVVTVSEETGGISYVKGNDLKNDVSPEMLSAFLIKEFVATTDK